MSIEQQRVLEGHVIEAVRPHAPLTGKPIVNRGPFSVLFGGETAASVYRLSSDNAPPMTLQPRQGEGLAGK